MKGTKLSPDSSARNFILLSLVLFFPNVHGEDDTLTIICAPLLMRILVTFSASPFRLYSATHKSSHTSKPTGTVCPPTSIRNGAGNPAANALAQSHLGALFPAGAAQQACQSIC